MFCGFVVPPAGGGQAHEVVGGGSEGEQASAVVYVEHDQADRHAGHRPRMPVTVLPLGQGSPRLVSCGSSASWASGG